MGESGIYYRRSMVDWLYWRRPKRVSTGWESEPRRYTWQIPRWAQPKIIRMINDETELGDGS